MVDLGTGIASIVPATIIVKILGPTAGYIGDSLKNLTEEQCENVARIFKNASNKLGDDCDTPGTIPPRVLKEVLDEGPFCDNELMAEYYGGILASGRTPDGRDDRAATYLKLTSQLSSYQVRLHYIAYTTFRKLFAGSNLRTTVENDLRRMHIFLPDSFLVSACDFTPEESGGLILSNTTTGLKQHDLLYTLVWGEKEYLNKVGSKALLSQWNNVDSSGIVIKPTQFGIDYYLWANGKGDTWRADFLEPSIEIPELENVKLGDGAVKVHKEG